MGHTLYSASFSAQGRQFTNCLPHSYLIVDNVVYLTIADKSYPRKLAFSFLDELSKEFAMSYGPKVEGVRKPYAFVGFGAVSGSISCKLLDSDHFPFDRHIHVEDRATVSGYTDG